MQKKIIALAVAGLVSGAAFAQSNVTVYGVADVYYGHFSATGGQTVNAINSGGLAGSRLGFKGTEDLGNGLKALFTLEYALAVDGNAGVGDINSSSTAQARQQFVGLTGGFGTVVAGRLQSPGYTASAKFDAHAASVLSPLGQLTDLNNNSISGRDVNMRFNNAVAYVTPNMSGFTGTVAYSFIGEQNTAPRSTGWTLSADYDNGPIAANYTHNDLTLATAAGAGTTTYSCGAGNDLIMGGAGIPVCHNTATNAIAAATATPVAGAAAFTTKQREDAIFGSYDFGAAKLIASWQDKRVSVAGAAASKSSVWDLGVVVPVGAGAVRFSYASLNDKTVADDDAKAWGIAYTHSLSKRTTAYAGYTYVDYKDAVPGSIGGVTPTAGGTVRAFGMGLNHAF